MAATLCVKQARHVNLFFETTRLKRHHSLHLTSCSYNSNTCAPRLTVERNLHRNDDRDTSCLGYAANTGTVHLQRKQEKEKKKKKKKKKKTRYSVV